MAQRDRILIIGNGFDLYHELPTKYSQFIEVLKNLEIIEITKDTIITFDDIFKDVDKFSEMKSRFNTEEMIFDEIKIAELKSNLINNKWYYFFKENIEFENWIDFENEIKETLIIFNSITKSIKNILHKNTFVYEIFINPTYEIGAYLYLNEKALKTASNFNLINEENELINENYFFKINESFIKFKSDVFFEDLFLDLQNFISIFNIYLNNVLSCFYPNIDSSFSSSLEKINLDINKFYTFNYTPTLENLYNIDSDKVSYLHGKHHIDSQNIVLGIDEINTELINDKIFMFTKYYQKLFNNTDYQFLSEMKISTSKYDSADKDFILFGHSLADNDQNYLLELFNVTKQRDQNTITILYHNINDKSQKLKNLLKIIGRNDIEFLMKKKRLIFIAINDNPFETVFKILPTGSNDSYAPEIF